MSIRLICLREWVQQFFFFYFLVMYSIKIKLSYDIGR